MIKKTNASNTVKREQKKSFFLKEISALVQQLAVDEPKLLYLYVTRVDFSKDLGILYVYCSTYTTREAFDEGLEILKLYKPSMRKALAQISHSRYTPDLLFLYDESKDKERKLNELLDQAQQNDLSLIEKKP